MNVKESLAGVESLGRKIWYQAMDHSRALLLHCASYRTSTVRGLFSSMGVRAF